MVTRIIAGELVSGVVLADVPVAAGSWKQVLGDAGEVSATVPLGDPGVAGLGLLPYLEPWRCFLAAVEDDTVLEAGPIVGHEYDDTDRTLQVKAMGLRHVFSKRLASRTGVNNPQRQVLEFSGLSLATIGKRLVQRALDNPRGELPVVLPADVSGTAERTYYGHELATVDERLSELSDVQNGPEFAFEPRLLNNGLSIEWVMRAGSPLLTQQGQDWVWDTSAARGGVAGLSVSKDAGDRVNNLFVAGEGMDEALKVARATDETDRAGGHPLLEDAFSHSSVKRQATLQAHADAYLEQGSAPWTTWKLSVAADVWPTVGVYRPGDWVRVFVGGGHPYIAEGGYRARISSVSGDVDGRMVSVELRPTLEARR